MDKLPRKRIRAIDYAQRSPLKAINAVWDVFDLDYVLHELEGWHYAALSHDESIYRGIEQRSAFIAFYNELLTFIEAMYFLNEIEDKEKAERSEKMSDEVKALYAGYNRPRKLDEKAISNPIPKIVNFCNVFPIEYVRVELWDFFEAVGVYDGVFQESIGRQNLFSLYEHLLTLLEAGFILVKRKGKYTSDRETVPVSSPMRYNFKYANAAISVRTLLKRCG